MDYKTFLKDKQIIDVPTGITDEIRISSKLFDFQKDIVKWALKRGRSAIFADCGMGKTAMQLEWAKHVPGRKLIFAPLAVGRQTQDEAKKFGIDDVKYLPADDYKTTIAVTNYERMHLFNPSDFNGVVLDESSILKSFTGKYRTELIDRWSKVRFRLAATATPAPNDFMELGNHSEFLGAMDHVEMLARFFVHDGGETQKWRLKGHAEQEFWRWMCSWSVMITKPGDLGYSNGGFDLPDCVTHQVKVKSDHRDVGMLFAMDARTLQERRTARKSTVHARVNAVADMVNKSNEPWIVWCDRNDESEALTKAISDAVEVRGSHDNSTKEKRMIGFSNGEYRVLVTKPSIAGWGMNWQHCSNIAFTGLSDSYEQYYQALRRCWRFGQTKQVNCYIITADIEGEVLRNIERKDADAKQMAKMMIENMQDLNQQNIKGLKRNDKTYNAKHKPQTPEFLV